MAAENTAAIAAPKNDWMRKHDAFVERASKGDVDVLFLGDSITAGWNKDVWKERYEPLKAANFGIGGDRTQNVLWRIQNGELEGISPKVVVLMIGTNNLSSNTPPEIAEGITAIVKDIRQRKPETKILLLGVFPRAKDAGNGARPKIAEINQMISKLDDGAKVFYLDIGDKFLEPDGSISSETMPDFLHLSPAGYKTWADAMDSRLQELLKSGS